MKIQHQLFQNRIEVRSRKLKYQAAFGQIRPEHLFINSPKYEKNQAWAKGVIAIIELAKVKVCKNEKFSNLMGFLSAEYGELLASKSKFFGQLRTDNQAVITYITSKNRYAPYLKKLKKIADEKGKNCGVEIGGPEGSYHESKLYRTYFKQDGILPRKRELSRIILAKDKLSREERENVGKSLLVVESLFPKNIKPTFKKIAPIYKKVIENKEMLTPQNIKEITKDIAKIHWYLSQVTPYCRGSAGIADTLSKTLFEAKGIQVSPYRTKIDPNLEAFVMPLEEYTEKYQGFFLRPPVTIV